LTRRKLDAKVMAPPSTHRRIATCKEVDCVQMLSGFELILADPPTPLPRDHAPCATPEKAARCSHCISHERLRYFRSGDSGRHFKEVRKVEGLVSFVFPPGEECFKQHSIPNGREALYSINGNKARGVDFIEHVGDTLAL